MSGNTKLLQLIETATAVIIREKELLTVLDQAIGDGDHGINMARGCKEVAVLLPDLGEQDIHTILKTVGMKLVSTVGGASGPLYGTALMKAGAVAADTDILDGEQLVAMFQAAIEGVQMRGKATAGEKTMLDALIPAYEAFKAEYAISGDVSLCLKRSVEAAENGVEYTKTIIATKGRASYLGERSLGHQDPGATSVLLILRAIDSAL